MDTKQSLSSTTYNFRGGAKSCMNDNNQPTGDEIVNGHNSMCAESGDFVVFIAARAGLGCFDCCFLVKP